MITISRTSPIALISGDAVFIGGHLTAQLLSKDIQVVIQDKLEKNHQEILQEYVKKTDSGLGEKGLVILNQEPFSKLDIELPRLDYAYFLVDETLDSGDYRTALENFIKYCSEFKPKIVLVSSVDLYDKNSPRANLRWAENFLAKSAQEHNLNARIVRLAPLFGPGMSLSGRDPIIRVVKAVLNDNLQSMNFSMDDVSSAIYVDDAINLLQKAAFHGSTMGKIFDGASLSPFKVHEISQALMDPIWYEKNGFIPSKLVSSPPPNLLKTQRELNWQAKTPIIKGLRETIAFLHQHREINDVTAPESNPSSATNEEKFIEPKEESQKVNTLHRMKLDISEQQEEKTLPKLNFWQEKQPVQQKRSNNWSNRIFFLIGVVIIGFGLLFPLAKVVLATVVLKSDFVQGQSLAEVGDLNQSQILLNSAQQNLAWLDAIYQSINMLRPEPILKQQADTMDMFKSVIDHSLAGSLDLVRGTQDLDQALALIKGAKDGDPQNLLFQAQTEFGNSQRDFSYVTAQNNIGSNLPSVLQAKMGTLQAQSMQFANQAGKLKQISLIISELISNPDESNYLVALSDNRILRGGGGVVIGVVRVQFKNGRLNQINVVPASQLDQKAKSLIAAPDNLKAVLNQKELNLADSAFDPDFVESAKWISLAYNTESGEKVDGVALLDMQGLRALLPQNQDIRVDGSNQLISADNLDTQSDDVKLSVLQQLVNNILFGDSHKWESLLSTLDSEASQKHLGLFFISPKLNSLTSAFNLTPNLKDFIPVDKAGEKNEIVLVSESNPSMVPQTELNRSINLTSIISAKGDIVHDLKIQYTNPSDSAYSFTISLYVPRGSKMIKTLWDNVDLTGKTISQNQNNFVVFTVPLLLKPGESKGLTLSYSDLLPLKFNNQGNLNFTIKLIKQMGSQEVPFGFSLKYPSSYKIVSLNHLNQESDGSVIDQTRFNSDLQFGVSFTQ